MNWSASIISSSKASTRLCQPLPSPGCRDYTGLRRRLGTVRGSPLFSAKVPANGGSVLSDATQKNATLVAIRQRSPVIM
jgi:hypothetical protein